MDVPKIAKLESIGAGKGIVYHDRHHYAFAAQPENPRLGVPAHYAWVTCHSIPRAEAVWRKGGCLQPTVDLKTYLARLTEGTPKYAAAAPAPAVPSPTRAETPVAKTRAAAETTAAETWAAETPAARALSPRPALSSVSAVSPVVNTPRSGTHNPERIATAALRKVVSWKLDQNAKLEMPLRGGELQDDLAASINVSPERLTHIVMTSLARMEHKMDSHEAAAAARGASLFGKIEDEAQATRGHNATLHDGASQHRTRIAAEHAASLQQLSLGAAEHQASLAAEQRARKAAEREKEAERDREAAERAEVEAAERAAKKAALEASQLERAAAAAERKASEEARLVQLSHSQATRAAAEAAQAAAEGSRAAAEATRADVARVEQLLARQATAALSGVVKQSEGQLQSTEQTGAPARELKLILSTMDSRDARRVRLFLVQVRTHAIALPCRLRRTHGRFGVGSRPSAARDSWRRQERRHPLAGHVALHDDSRVSQGEQARCRRGAAGRVLPRADARGAVEQEPGERGLRGRLRDLRVDGARRRPAQDGERDLLPRVPGRAEPNCAAHHRQPSHARGMPGTP
jgi:hypothetical protein